MQFTVASSPPPLVLQSVHLAVVALYVGGRIWAQWCCSHDEPDKHLEDRAMWAQTSVVCVRASPFGMADVGQTECCRK